MWIKNFYPLISAHTTILFVENVSFVQIYDTISWFGGNYLTRTSEKRKNCKHSENFCRPPSRGIASAKLDRRILCAILSENDRNIVINEQGRERGKNFSPKSKITSHTNGTRWGLIVGSWRRWYSDFLMLGAGCNLFSVFAFLHSLHILIALFSNKWRRRKTKLLSIFFVNFPMHSMLHWIEYWE